MDGYTFSLPGTNIKNPSIGTFCRFAVRLLVDYSAGAALALVGSKNGSNCKGIGLGIGIANVVFLVLVLFYAFVYALYMFSDRVSNEDKKLRSKAKMIVLFFFSIAALTANCGGGWYFNHHPDKCESRDPNLVIAIVAGVSNAVPDILEPYFLEPF